MKKTRAITLTLLTGGTLMVSGCSENPQDNATFFKDQTECMAQWRDSEICNKSEKSAQEAHAKSAPKYNAKDVCEAQHGVGNCQVAPQNTPTHQASTGGSWFIPMMMGYMMGRVQGPGLFGGSRYAAEPVYRDRENNAYTGSGISAAGVGRVVNGKLEPNTAYRQKWSSPQSRAQLAGSDSSIKRGGFGTTGHSASS